VPSLFVGLFYLLARNNVFLAIGDQNTTGWLGQQWIDKWSMSSQISGYVWAARQLYNEPVIGAFITGLEWRAPRKEPNRKCKTHSVPQRECEMQHNKYELVGLIERNEAMLENWYAEAVPMAQGLYRLSQEIGNDLDKLVVLRMEGPFTGECEAFGAGGCEYRKGVCEIGRRAGVARAALEFNPWNPLEGA
jgi:hypothetical protein